MTDTEKEKGTEPSAPLTPMMKQYRDLRDRYKNYVLFYRLGDFYEMFAEDAVRVSRELDLTLTHRGGVQMCGIPYHASETYIKRLIEKGFKVAVCEQTGNNTALKGIAERNVVRIVTAGTLFEDSMLDENSNNFIGCFYAGEQFCGVVFGDVSTGEIHLFEKRGAFSEIESETVAEISRYMPSEILFNPAFMNYRTVSDFIKNKLHNCSGEIFEEEKFCSADLSAVYRQFDAKSLTEKGIDEKPYALAALAVLLGYVNETQKDSVTRFAEITVHNGGEFMELGLSARKNLELTETFRGKERKGSLLWVLDKNKTAMGKRKLKQFIERPLVNHHEILRRLYAVEELVKNPVLLEDLRELLGKVHDMERLMTRVVYKSASPRDVFMLGKTCEVLPDIKKLLGKAGSMLLKTLDESINALEDVSRLVNNAMNDELPANLKDGNVVRAGFNAELDRLRNITGDNETLLSEIERREKNTTGIKNLRVSYNRVFGYYIEVSKSNVNSVPPHYVRKQTLTTGERFITDELKKIENEILGANEKILVLEEEIFSEVRGFINGKLGLIQKTAGTIAVLDVICSFAVVSAQNNYNRPEITLENVIDIKDGRHPVVEKLLSDTVFTPNDAYLDGNKNKLILLTGPNMAGKSTYMRQVAIIALMAQIGCFVPARSARIGIADKIFTRIGASDDITAGQSTFMLEMCEVADILNNATNKSLVILDEIGRGTSTFDGISIAKAAAEYINGQIGCKTLFATHYHELIALEKTNEGIKNFSVAIKRRGDDIQFMHKIVEGGTDDSYGIEVAKLAGLPAKVIREAKKALSQMERNSKIELESELREKEISAEQIEFSSIAKEKVISSIKNLDTESLKPIEALQILDELKRTL